ncbi:MAG: hypothetical protein ABI775_10435 [Pseudonocardiales bacterium]
MRYALDHYERAEFEAAMLHACLALDGSAKKLYPEVANNNRERFERIIRDHLDVFGAFAAPGIDLEATRFPIRVEVGAKRVGLDAASILYKIHRCTHGHGDELPNGFECLPPDGDKVTFTVNIDSGTVAMSTTAILGLIAVAVLCPPNHDQEIPMTYSVWQPLMADDGRRDRVVIPIHQWWGRLNDFRAILQKFPRGKLTLEFRPEHFE